MAQEKRDYNSMEEVEEAAMWLKETKAGDKFLSGIVKVDGKEYKLSLFRNKFKEEGSKQPDFRYGNKKPAQAQEGDTGIGF